MKDILRKVTCKNFILPLAGIFKGTAMTLGVKSSNINDRAGMYGG